jgi:hypothetical protein
MKKTFTDFLRMLPTDYPSLARQFQAFSRSRKIQDPAQLLRLIFLYSIAGQTIRQISSTFTLLEQEISGESIRKRLSSSVPFLQALAHQMLQQKNAPDQKSQAFSKLIAIDATSFSAFGGKGPEYRLHTALNLNTLTLEQCTVSQTNLGEKFSNFHFEKGDLVLADRVYCSFPHLSYVLSKNADFLVRYNTRQVSLHSPESGVRVPPPELVQILKGHRRHTPITFEFDLGSQKSDERHRVWMHARRLPRKKARQRRKQYLKGLKREKRKRCESMEYLQGWIIVLSSVSPADLPGEEALELYRHRWQIELYFKRLKSLLELDELRAKKGSPLAQVWILGKLIWAILLEKSEAEYGIKEEYVANRESSWANWQFLIQIHINAILGIESWKEENLDAALLKLSNRTRKRALLSFTSRVPQLSEVPLLSRFRA